MLTVQPMTFAHLDAVMQIQLQCYPPNMQEDPERIIARLQGSPAQSWIAADAEGCCGYLFGYLSRRGRVTPLNADFQPRVDGDCLYLHDLAVAPHAGGRRVGQQLVARAMEHAAALRLAWSALVSVQDSQLFWERLGYRSGTPCDAQHSAHLASYPVAARYMERTLT